MTPYAYTFQLVLLTKFKCACILHTHGTQLGAVYVMMALLLLDVQEIL
jgi:hypothetical protein